MEFDLLSKRLNVLTIDLNLVEYEHVYCGVTVQR